ncbi:hypothetical protein ACP70R_032564 [Stipagrostis hirtigluma subsp. patula]
MTPALVKLDDDVVRPPLAVASHGVLPADVLFDVLLRLPADELCRLRLVCRSWHSLTSDRPFTKAARPTRHATRTSSPLIGSTAARFTSWACPATSSGGYALISSVTVQVFRLICSAFHSSGDRPTRATLSPAWSSATWPTSVAYHLCLGLGMSPPQESTRCSAFSRSHGRTCEVRTLGSGSNGGWRQRPWPPAKIEPDSIASFDLATEEWRPTMIQGPLSSVFASTGDKLKYRIHRRDLS